MLDKIISALGYTCIKEININELYLIKYITMKSKSFCKIFSTLPFCSRWIVPCITNAKLIHFHTGLIHFCYMYQLYINKLFKIRRTVQYHIVVAFLSLFLPWCIKMWTPCSVEFRTLGGCYIFYLG